MSDDISKVIKILNSRIDVMTNNRYLLNKDNPYYGELCQNIARTEMCIKLIKKVFR